MKIPGALALAFSVTWFCKPSTENSKPNYAKIFPHISITDKQKKPKPLLDLHSSSELNAFIFDENHTFKSPKNTILIFVDTLRRDFITPELAPHLSKFIKESTFVPHSSYSGSTTTHYSTYSVFYGRHAYLRDLTLLNKWDKGSIFLNILKQGGYKINLYGSPWQYCFDSSNFYDSPDFLHNYAQSNLQSIYGLKMSNLIDFCYQHGPGEMNQQLNPETIPQAIDADGEVVFHQAYRDHQVTSDLIAALPAMGKEKNFVFYYLFGVHDPYSWLDQGLDDHHGQKLKSEDLFPIDIPNLPWKSYFSTPADKISHKTDYINSYKNAIRSVDYEINRLFEALKAQDAWQDTAIAFISDHGELLFAQQLYDSTYNGRVTHCCKVFEENTNVPIIYHLPGTSSLSPPFGSHLDIFPSLFAYLGYNFPSSFNRIVQGRPISENNRTCAISFDPRGDPMSTTFTVHTASGKLTGILDGISPQKTRGFYISSLWDKNDKADLAFTTTNLLSERAAIATKWLAKEDISLCIDELFGSTSVISIDK